MNNKEKYLLFKSLAIIFGGIAFGLWLAYLIL